MHVFELIYPGTWLDYENKEWAREVENILMLIESAFTESAVSLALFEGERLRSRKLMKDKWEENQRLRQQLMERLQNELGTETFLKTYQFQTDIIDLEVNREKWRKGILPDCYEHQLVFIFAKAFLYSVDNLLKLIQVMAEMEDVPEEIETVKKAFLAQFPTLQEVRNTAQHIEDRGRRLDKRGKPLKLNPIKNKLVHAFGGVLALNCLNGNKYGNTMSDGHYGEVEVSKETLLFIRDGLQQILDCFKWQGSKRFYPR